MKFREDIFIKALTQRAETCRIMSQTFRAEWLERAEYQPVLQAIYEFMLEKNIPPEISTLHDIFLQKDKSLYNARIRQVIEEIDKSSDSTSDFILATDTARDVAIARSFTDLVNSPVLSELTEESDGGQLMREVEMWMRSFQQGDVDVDLDIREAIHKLCKENRQEKDSRISTGIKVLDDWCSGGIRSKNLAIILAPTGHGKSTALMIIAHNIAKQGNKVLFISNELSMEEMSERFLSRLSGLNLDTVLENPNAAKGIDHHWRSGLHKNLRLLEVAREISSDEIEAQIMKFISLYGWRPDVVVIDFMERMKPSVSGVRRDQSWNWIGSIAKDLMRMAKKGNWLVWTAGQTNRKGYDNHNSLSLEHAQGSVQHLQEAAFVVAMRQKNDLPLDDKDMTLLEFKPLKMRHSKNPGNTVLVEAKLGQMKITDNIRDPREWINDQNMDEEGNPIPVKFPSKT